MHGTAKCSARRVRRGGHASGRPAISVEGMISSGNGVFTTKGASPALRQHLDAEQRRTFEALLGQVLRAAHDDVRLEHRVVRNLPVERRAEDEEVAGSGRLERDADAQYARLVGWDRRW